MSDPPSLGPIRTLALVIAAGIFTAWLVALVLSFFEVDRVVPGQLWGLMTIIATAMVAVVVRPNGGRKEEPKP